MELAGSARRTGLFLPPSILLIDFLCVSAALRESFFLRIRGKNQGWLPLQRILFPPTLAASAYAELRRDTSSRHDVELGSLCDQGVREWEAFWCIGIFRKTRRLDKGSQARINAMIQSMRTKNVVRMKARFPLQDRRRAKGLHCG